MDLEELGVHGWARVTAVEACPKVVSGAGRVVTATFTHVNETVQRLELAAEGFAGEEAGAVEVLEPTAAHPLFSLTRGDWVKAGELVPGERLQTRGGAAEVLSVTPSTGAQRVFNFEVEGEHEYLVGGLGVRSHNACTPDAPKVKPPAKVPLAADGLPKGGTYVLKDGNGNVVRTGRSKDLERREKQHKKEFPDHDFEAKHRTNDYEQQRGLEEKLYNENPGALEENGGLNKIKSISDRNDKGPIYREAANSYVPPEPVL